MDGELTDDEESMIENEENEQNEGNENKNEDKDLELDAFNDCEANDINLCNKMDNIVYDVRLQDYRQDKNEHHNMFCHRICKEAIQEENNKIVQGVGGPNKSLKTKMEQLQLHERIHCLTESGVLLKNDLSHYLDATKNYRQQLLEQGDMKQKY